VKKKKKLPGPEPLLNVVARKLGRAAGAVAKVTHEVTGSLSSVTDAVATRVSKSAPKVKSNSSRAGRGQAHRALAERSAPKRRPAKKRSSGTGPRRATKS
jgi:hypothetical protein